MLHICISFLSETCPGAVATFEAKKGMFLTGEIIPKLAGVQITIKPEDAMENITEVLTDENGSYRLV